MTGEIDLPSFNTKCPNGIIPNRVDVTYYARTANFMKISDNFLDGTPIKKQPYTMRSESIDACRKGSKEGENTNYYYCNELLYERTPVDKSGNIEKTIEYEVKLILDTNDYTNETVDSWGIA